MRWSGPLADTKMSDAAIVSALPPNATLEDRL